MCRTLGYVKSYSPFSLIWNTHLLLNNNCMSWSGRWQQWSKWNPRAQLDNNFEIFPVYMSEYLSTMWSCITWYVLSYLSSLLCFSIPLGCINCIVYGATYFVTTWHIHSLVTQVTKQHNDDCKKLLRLMGVPVIEVMHWNKFGY